MICCAASDTAGSAHTELRTVQTLITSLGEKLGLEQGVPLLQVCDKPGQYAYNCTLLRTVRGDTARGVCGCMYACVCVRVCVCVCVQADGSGPKWGPLDDVVMVSVHTGHTVFSLQ